MQACDKVLYIRGKGDTMIEGDVAYRSPEGLRSNKVPLRLRRQPGGKRTLGKEGGGNERADAVREEEEEEEPHLSEKGERGKGEEVEKENDSFN